MAESLTFDQKMLISNLYVYLTSSETAKLVVELSFRAFIYSNSLKMPTILIFMLYQGFLAYFVLFTPC